jgi:salicylate hydroxylase
MFPDSHALKLIYVGMGGLTCALALAKAGFRIIEVYELASNLGFVGAGIQLAPNMVRILDRLGVWKDIEREAVILNEASVRRMSLESKYIIETDFYRGGDR